MKKPVAKYWTTSAVARMEPHIDSVVAFFARQLQDRYADGIEGKMGKAFDFGDWAMFCKLWRQFVAFALFVLLTDLYCPVAWDAVSKTTMSKRIGYLDHGNDFDGTLATAVKASKYLTTIGMYPVLDKFLEKNPVYRIGPPSYTTIAMLAVKLLTDRLTGKDGHDSEAQPDFMDHYIEAQKQYPDIVDDTMVISCKSSIPNYKEKTTMRGCLDEFQANELTPILTDILVNLAAGADTSAAALRTIFYLCLRDRAVWTKLSEAVLAAPFAQPGSVQLPAPYSQTRGVPYLEAVIREALRLYPGNLFPQERVVPAGGLKLPDGRFVPEGTALGFNAYVMHRNKAIWGPDAEEFRPERFIRSEDESEPAFNERMRLYNESDLSFGAGSRKCIGMNLAMMEVYKSVATLVAMFDFELATQDEWTVKAELFPRATGIVCRIRQRAGMVLREDIDHSS